jgi:hypothetical protein
MREGCPAREDYRDRQADEGDDVGDAVDRTAGAGAVMSRLTVHTKQRRRANGLVAQLAVSRLPRTLTRATAIEEVNTGPGGAYARLEEAGHVIASFVEHVGARMPTPDEVTTLQLDEGTPVITVTLRGLRSRRDIAGDERHGASRQRLRGLLRVARRLAHEE